MSVRSEADRLTVSPAATVRGRLSRAVLPTAQRRGLSEVADRLYLMEGDQRAKQSAFATMIVISGVVATAGVLADSTATVIGAMIIAPMSTPIMGMALAIVEARAARLLTSALFVLGGALVVVATGALASLALPSAADLTLNSQVTGRTAPSLLDLVAALATGLAGAVGLSRRDVADVLPGVAIAISLVPPLAVVGVTLGAGEPHLALGALLLFLSNVVSLVLAGTLVFTGYGYVGEALGARAPMGARAPRRRVYAAMAACLLAVLVPLGVNTAAQIRQTIWTEVLRTRTQAWLDASGRGGDVVRVEVRAGRAVILVRTEHALPDTQELLRSLAGGVPAGTDIMITLTLGTDVTVGQVGG